MNKVLLNLTRLGGVAFVFSIAALAVAQGGSDQWFSEYAARVNEIKVPVFVSGCYVKDGEYFPSGTGLVWVYEGNGGVILRISDAAISYLAGVAYGKRSPSGKEYLEAQGGIWSANRARDILDYLKTRPFQLVEKIDKPVLRKIADMSVCDILFDETERYENTSTQGTSGQEKSE